MVGRFTIGPYSHKRYDISIHLRLNHGPCRSHERKRINSTQLNSTLTNQLNSKLNSTLPTPVRLGGEEAGLGRPACEHLDEGHGRGGGDSQAAQFGLSGQAAAASEAGVEGGGEGDGPTALAFGAAAEEIPQYLPARHVFGIHPPLIPPSLPTFTSPPYKPRQQAQGALCGNPARLEGDGALGE